VGFLGRIVSLENKFRYFMNEPNSAFIGLLKDLKDFLYFIEFHGENYKLSGCVLKCLL
jgi:hypothetical protein